MTLKRTALKEGFVYLVLWGVMFIAPLVAIYVHSLSGSHQDGFPWGEVMRVWRLLAVFLTVFLVHNYLIAPMLIYRHRRLAYALSVALLLIAFGLWQCRGDGRMPPPPHEAGKARTERTDRPQERRERKPTNERHDHPPFHDVPPPMMQMEHTFSVIVFFLVLGMNLGVKYYFKAEEDHKKMEELERKSLEQQLAYLKYQINPHFFMNTLNNIHALVDIDPAKAQETILILSKIMRHVLYEGDRSLIPLQREVNFLDNYIKLMRIRCADQVDISVDVDNSLPEAGIPPLLLITFVENAFKHGISYNQKSFIHITMSIDDNKLRFVCRNSKVKRMETGSPANEQKGGVGLANVKQRLELIYGKDFTLDINDADDAYEVMLLLPLMNVEQIKDERS